MPQTEQFKKVKDVLIKKGLDEVNAVRAAINTLDLDVSLDNIDAALSRETYSQVLWSLFTWKESREGHEYWHNIVEKR
jgi:hypothetical protein